MCYSLLIILIYNYVFCNATFYYTILYILFNGVFYTTICNTVYFNFSFLYKGIGFALCRYNSVYISSYKVVDCYLSYVCSSRPIFLFFATCTRK